MKSWQWTDEYGKDSRKNFAPAQGTIGIDADDYDDDDDDDDINMTVFFLTYVNSAVERTSLNCLRSNRKDCNQLK
jgi:hypothetical protein